MKPSLQYRALRLGTALCALALVGGGTVFLTGQAQAQTGGQGKADPDAAQQVQVGDTIITSENLDYDLSDKKYTFSGKKQVELTSPTNHMLADTMLISMDPQNQVQAMNCVGHVFVERKTAQGTTDRAWGDHMEYYQANKAENKPQTAFLIGHVIVHQESEKLAKPAVITGSRVDMNLDTNDNVVHRTTDAQAKVHLEPKGDAEAPAAGTTAAAAAPSTGPGTAAPPPTSTPAAPGEPGAAAGGAKPGAAKPAPEPADLYGDQIDMNSKDQSYVATGNPVLIRPSSRLQGRTIRFKIDEKTSNINTARADEDVVFDGKNEKGSVMHATGDHGEYDDIHHLMTLIGHVQATRKDPTDEHPTTYRCGKFVYNTQSGHEEMSDHVKLVIPPAQKPADGASEGAPGDKPGKKPVQPGARPAGKPVDKTLPAPGATAAPPPGAGAGSAKDK